MKNTAINVQRYYQILYIVLNNGSLSNPWNRNRHFTISVYTHIYICRWYVRGKGRYIFFEKSKITSAKVLAVSEVRFEKFDPAGLKLLPSFFVCIYKTIVPMKTLCGLRRLCRHYKDILFLPRFFPSPNDLFFCCGWFSFAAPKANVEIPTIYI